MKVDIMESELIEYQVLGWVGILGDEISRDGIGGK